MAQFQGMVGSGIGEQEFEGEVMGIGAQFWESEQLSREMEEQMERETGGAMAIDFSEVLDFSGEQFGSEQDLQCFGEQFGENLWGGLGGGMGFPGVQPGDLQDLGGEQASRSGSQFSEVNQQATAGNDFDEYAQGVSVDEPTSQQVTVGDDGFGSLFGDEDPVEQGAVEWREGASGGAPLGQDPSPALGWRNDFDFEFAHALRNTDAYGIPPAATASSSAVASFDTVSGDALSARPQGYSAPGSPSGPIWAPVPAAPEAGYFPFGPRLLSETVAPVDAALATAYLRPAAAPLAAPLPDDVAAAATAAAPAFTVAAHPAAKGKKPKAGKRMGKMTADGKIAMIDRRQGRGDKVASGRVGRSDKQVQNNDRKKVAALEKAAEEKGWWESGEAAGAAMGDEQAKQLAGTLVPYAPRVQAPVVHEDEKKRLNAESARRSQDKKRGERFMAWQRARVFCEYVLLPLPKLLGVSLKALQEDWERSVAALPAGGWCSDRHYKPREEEANFVLEGVMLEVPEEEMEEGEEE
jgi:hypothetical protein